MNRELADLKKRKQHSWTDRPDKFVDTDRVMAVGAHFFKHGCYTPATEGTLEWYDFWDREVDRCLYGYVVDAGKKNELYVTGFHYFYLNYTPIERTVREEQPDGSILETREFQFPWFYDGDWEYFMAIEEARRTGKHIAVLKARRKGYSFKAASMLNRNYFLKRKSKNFVFVSDSSDLDEDGILSKAWDMLSFVNDNTAWTQPTLTDTTTHKQSGYKEIVFGTEIAKGMQSQIIGITVKSPDKVRGKAGDLMLFEEGGRFPHLKRAWEIAEPTVKQGTSTLGIMIAFGTGGTEGPGILGLEQLFYDTEANSIFEIENTFEQGMEGTNIGWFHPYWKNLEGFIDEDGNSLVSEAMEFSEKERKLKSKSSDQKSVDQFIAERANTPREALLQSAVNNLPVGEIGEQYARVMGRKLYNLGTHGELVETGKGVKFILNKRKKPIIQFPHTSEVNLEGCVTIYESPVKIKGEIPKHLYVVVHDPYAHDKGGNSLGSAYVIKRVSNISADGDKIVAGYVGRPGTLDEYNHQLFLLAKYYNAKIGFENDRGDVLGYAKRFKKLSLLEGEFMMAHNKDLQSKAVSRGFGMHMTKDRKQMGELYLRDWLLKVRGKDAETGASILNVHTIYDPALLKEMLAYNLDGNFDRTMSLIVGMYHLKELHSILPKAEQDNDLNSFFNRTYFGEDTSGGHYVNKHGYQTDVFGN